MKPSQSRAKQQSRQPTLCTNGHNVEALQGKMPDRRSYRLLRSCIDDRDDATEPRPDVLKSPNCWRLVRSVKVSDASSLSGRLVVSNWSRPSGAGSEKGSFFRARVWDDGSGADWTLSSVSTEGKRSSFGEGARVRAAGERGVDLITLRMVVSTCGDGGA
jgi:hypothetical protein